MQYQKIALGDVPRREQFLYFHGMANPYAGVTAEADIAPLLARCKASGVRVSLAIVYVMAGRQTASPRCGSGSWTGSRCSLTSVRPHIPSCGRTAATAIAA